MPKETYNVIKRYREVRKVQIVREKNLSDGEKIELVRNILEMFREKGISIRQASEILAATQQELQNFPITG